MFCPTCGNSLPDGATFCPRCGCAAPTGATDAAFCGAAAREPFSFGYSWRAFKSFWTFKNWSARATRTEYWSFFLWQFVLQTSALSLVALIGALSTLTFVALAGSNVDATPFEQAFNVEINESGTIAETSGPCAVPIKLGAPFAPRTTFTLFGSLALFWGIYFVSSLVFIVPKFCATVRRLHDCGANGAFAVLLFVPSLATLATIAIGLIDPTPGANEFGPNPRFAPPRTTQPPQSVQPPQENAAPTSDASTREGANNDTTDR